MEPEGLVVLVVAGIGVVPIEMAWAAVVAARLVADRSVVVACRVAERVPGVHLTVPHHRR